VQKIQTWKFVCFANDQKQENRESNSKSMRVKNNQVLVHHGTDLEIAEIL